MKKPYIKREEVRVNIERLSKKHKDKYRYKAVAEAVIYMPHQKDSWDNIETRTLESGGCYSKTEKGARITAVTKLLQKCRPPLTHKQKIEINIRYKEGCYKIDRTVYIEVHVSNALKFIKEDGEDPTWYEIV